MATLYFNGAVDNDWDTLGNWWLDDTFTTPATSLPSNTDDVVITGTGYTFPDAGCVASGKTINSLIVNSMSVDLQITITGTSTFNGDSASFGILYGNVIFNDTSQNNVTGYGATIYGDCTFNNSSINNGNITGDCTFNNSSYNDGTITGDCTFNDDSYNEASGIVNGNPVFNDYSFNNGFISGDGTFNEFSYNNYGTVNGNATFNDSSYNYYIVNGNATFNNSSYNQVGGGTINGNATFNDSSYNDGTITGDCTFNDTSTSSTGHIDGNVIFNDSSTHGGGTVGDAFTITMNDYSSITNGMSHYYQVTLNNYATSSGDSYAIEFILNDNSSGNFIGNYIDINGNPIGNCYLDTVSYSFNSQAAVRLTITRRSGVNGSSILGLI